MIFLTAVESVLSVVLLIALGFVLRQRGWFADTFAANISRLIMNIALPASIFVSVLTYLHRDQLAALSDGLIYGVASLLLGYPMAWLMVKVLKVRPGRRGVFINTIVNANTIFIGLPLNVALFGDAAMPYFLVYYVLNTVSTWAFGVFLIARAALGLFAGDGLPAGRYSGAVIRPCRARLYRRDGNAAFASLYRNHLVRCGAGKHPLRPRYHRRVAG